METVEQALRNSESRRVRALLDADMDELEALLSESLVYHHASGAIDDKASYLAPIRSGELRFLAIEQSGVRLDILDTAVIFRGTISNSVAVRGVQTVLTTRYFSVWALASERWRMIAWSSAYCAGS